MSRDVFEALPEIAERVARAEHILVCAEFDGTLTPIVQDPHQGSLSEPTREILQTLVQRDRFSVAILSGRELSDLEVRLNIPGTFAIGNHGLEISGPGGTYVESGAVDASPALRQLTKQLAHRLQNLPGVFVEDKGLSASVHYRHVAGDDWETLRHQVHAALATASHPFVLTSGAKVFEIRPRVYWNRGAAIGWIKERLACPALLIVYLGEDVPEEEPAGPLADMITIKTREESETTASYHLAGQQDVQRFLQWLVRCNHSSQPPVAQSL
jgi:trehalose-phosphatase